MNIIDAIILLLIALGAIVGFKQGAIKRLTSFLGTIIIIVIAFTFKNNLSVIMYESLPFFSFGGIIKGVEVINILVYELLAFLIIFAFLTFILRILLVISGLIETILKMTIFLSIPSKILGLFVGAFEYYVYIFITLVFISLPVFNIDIIKDSNLATNILNNTPVLSGIAGDTVETYSEVYEILHDKDSKTSTQLNSEILVILLDKDIITPDSVDKLLERQKITLSDTSILDNYR